MKKKILLILLLFVSLLSAQIKVEHFRLADSRWTAEDKFVHCFGGWVLNNQLDKTRPWWQAFYKNNY
jgi:hypothetical protein